MEERDRLSECIAYVKSEEILDRLLRLFREKYRSYGVFAGTVRLKIQTDSQREALEGFLQQPLRGKASVSVSAQRFARAIAHSRYAGLEPEELLRAYFGELPLTHRQERQERETEWAAACRRTAADLPKPEQEGRRMLKLLEETHDEVKELSAIVRRQAGGDRRHLQERLSLLANILRFLPGERGEAEYLAVFAARLTGNPHAFDRGSENGRLLEALLRWRGGWRKTRQSITGLDEFPALRRQRLYLEHGLLLDDVSNYAIMYGVRARLKEGGFHPGMDGFVRRGEIAQIPLSVLARWEGVVCPDNVIHIVENPSIFALSCRGETGQAWMCMNGQPNLAGILFLQLLDVSGVHVYYGGDFDPEGLLIAERLKRSYGGSFSFWHMAPEDYRLSGAAAPISERRLHMLDRLTDPELCRTAALIREKRMAGYQENVYEKCDA